MPENPLQFVTSSVEKISSFIQMNFSNLMDQTHHNHSSITNKQQSIFSHSHSHSHFVVSEAIKQPKDTKEKSGGPVSKEELGRSSWTLLHTLAARYPDKPSRQQKKDAKEMMAILSRMYPCKDCADHFKVIIRQNPVQVGSREEFSQWLCYVHNIVNRSIGKPVFPCERLEARWGKSECENRECDVLGNTLDFPTGLQ